MYPNEVNVFQQDGATSHTSRATQSYLEDSTSSFIKKNMNGPPTSRLQFHGLQCMGFTFRESLQQKDDWFSEEKLKDVIRQKWREIPQDKI